MFLEFWEAVSVLCILLVISILKWIIWVKNFKCTKNNCFSARACLGPMLRMWNFRALRVELQEVNHMNSFCSVVALTCELCWFVCGVPLLMAILLRRNLHPTRHHQCRYLHLHQNPHHSLKALLPPLRNFFYQKCFCSKQKQDSVNELL